MGADGVSEEVLRPFTDRNTTTVLNTLYSDRIENSKGDSSKKEGRRGRAYKRKVSMRNASSAISHLFPAAIYYWFTDAVGSSCSSSSSPPPILSATN